MRNKKDPPRFQKYSILFFACIIVSLSGCPLFGLFSGGVKLNEEISGELDSKDESFYDAGGTFAITENSNISVQSGKWYFDEYKVSLKSGTSYFFEVWTDRDVSVILDIDEFGQQLGPWDDTTDGYLRYEVPSTFSGTLSFQFYIRAEFVGSASWYRFRINEE